MFPVLILAGGLGTRLGDRTRETPKVMLKVSGRPFIEWQLRFLARQGVSKVVLSVGHMADIIESFVGDGRQFNLSVHYLYDGVTLLGTGGAVRKATHLVDPPFFILYGDSLLPIEFEPVQKAFLSTNGDTLMTVFKNQGRWDTSNVEFAPPFVRLYDKKSPNNQMSYIDYGLNILSSNSLSFFPNETAFDLGTVFNNLSRHGSLRGYEVFQRFYEIGSEQGLVDTEVYLNRIEHELY